MMLEYVDKYLNNKLKENDKYIVFTFFELRIKENLSSEDSLSLLHLVAQRLSNIGYLVYRTNQEYTYNNKKLRVQENELLVAIKK